MEGQAEVLIKLYELNRALITPVLKYLAYIILFAVGGRELYKIIQKQIQNRRLLRELNSVLDVDGIRGQTPIIWSREVVKKLLLARDQDAIERAVPEKDYKELERFTAYLKLNHSNEDWFVDYVTLATFFLPLSTENKQTPLDLRSFMSELISRNFDGTAIRGSFGLPITTQDHKLKVDTDLLDRLRAEYTAFKQE